MDTEWQKLFGFPERQEFVKNVIHANDTHIRPAIRRALSDVGSNERAIVYALCAAALDLCHQIEPDERAADALFQQIATSSLDLRLCRACGAMPPMRPENPRCASTRRRYDCAFSGSLP